MEYLHENLLYIKQKDIRLYEKISAIVSDAQKINGIKSKFNVIETKDNEKTIEILQETNRGVRLNSVYNSKKEAEKFVKKYENIDRITVLIMYGNGNGIFYNEFQNKLDDASMVFIYEPDIELFIFCLMNFNMSNILLNNRCFIYVQNVNENEFLMDLYKKTNWLMLQGQITFYHPSYDKIDKIKINKFKIIIERYIYALKVQKNTSIKYSKLFTINAINNMSFIKNSNYVGELVGKIDVDIPVIIVSAGPSLDKNIDDLKKAEKKSFILATDTSVKYLLEHGVEFDAIVTVDGDKQIDDLGGKLCEYKPVFTILNAKNQLLRENKGRKIWITGQGYLEEIYKKYGHIFPDYIAGGSVATAAFEVARILGTKKIILVGQDLAYLGKSTHAGSIIDYHTEEKECLYVDGINVEKVKTRGDWVKYLQWFENAIAQLGNDIQVIDATEGGAKIKGTKIMKLSDTIEEYCQKGFDFEKVMFEMYPTFVSNKYDSVKNDICSIMYELDIISKASMSGILAAERIIDGIQKNKVHDNLVQYTLGKISEVRYTIQQQKVYVLIDEYISADSAYILDYENRKYADEIEKLYYYAKKSIIVFKALKRAVTDLKPIVSEMVRQL